MVNTQLLDNCIKRNGLKIGYICDQLGITRQAFGRKRRNLNSFKAAEIFVLCELCHISEAEKDEIFLS